MNPLAGSGGTGKSPFHPRLEMIRILHTADWHLGQVFHGYDRDYEHRLFLENLRRIIVDRKIDTLLIAGDIFDTANPSAAAQRRFFGFLADAHADHPNLQTVITAGNHDAGARLEAPAGLLERMKITIVGTVKFTDEGAIDYEKFLVPLKDPAGEIAALAVAVPFLRHSDVPFVPDSTNGYVDGIRWLYRAAVEVAENFRERACPGVPIVALGHCHMLDTAESRDSERRIVVGGAEALPAEIFPSAVAYAALGHLHKPQELDGGRIRYSGSPIPLSFSEKDYPHRVVEIELGAGKAPVISDVRLPKTAILHSIPAKGAAPVSEVIQALVDEVFPSDIPAEQHPFLEIRVLDDGPDPTRRRRIEEALADKPVRLASIKLELPASSVVQEQASLPVLSPEALQNLDPVEVMIAAHRDRFKTEPEDELISALREVMAQDEAEAS